MIIEHKKLLPFAWVLASIAVLLMCVDSCVLAGGECFRGGEHMLVCMVFITLPCGLLYPLGLSLLFDSLSVDNPVTYFLLWLGAFIVGYLQWFVIVPGLFSLRGITTLKLTENRKFDAKKKKGRARRRRKKILKARRESCASTQWDEHGRTPLERALDSAARHYGSSQMLAEERGDFPAVEINPGALAARVMPARQPRDIHGDAMPLGLADHVARKVSRKS